MWFDLKGDERITQRCATEGCPGQVMYRLEADGVGSNYCSGCRAKIEAEPMERVYVLIQLHPHGGDGFSVVAVFRDYETAQVEARALGVDQCRVLATDLK